MRDHLRSKQELCQELTALRKQVADLKEAMLARRRVEDALRHSEEQMRSLTDSAPVGLCSFRPDGTPVVANRPFAQVLGYDTPAELLRMGEVLGVFDGPEDRDRVLAVARNRDDHPVRVTFRTKDGTRLVLGAMGACSLEQDAITIVALAVSPDSSAELRQHCLGNGRG